MILSNVSICSSDKFLAFLDIAKATNGHTILIPKKHYKDINDIEDDILKDYNNLINVTVAYKDAGSTVKEMASKFSDISNEISD